MSSTTHQISRLTFGLIATVILSSVLAMCPNHTAGCVTYPYSAKVINRFGAKLLVKSNVTSCPAAPISIEAGKSADFSLDIRSNGVNLTATVSSTGLSSSRQIGQYFSSGRKSVTLYIKRTASGYPSIDDKP